MMDPIQELENRIRELSEKIDGFSNQVKPFDLSMNDIQEEKKAIEKKVDEDNQKILDDARQRIEENQEFLRVTVAELVNKYNEARENKMQILHQLNQLKEELTKLEREKLNLVQLLAARERLEEAEKKFMKIIEDAPFKDAILDFQFEDIVFSFDAWQQELNGILNANDMGLGKTFESIAFIYAFTIDFYNKHNRLPRILWLTKKSLIKTTHREIRRWNPEQKAIAFTNSGDKSMRAQILEFALMANSIVITNYEALNSNPTLMDTEWDLLCCDEVHKLRGGANPSGPTAIWKNVKTISEKTKFINFLTGSPINNHPREMWAYLNIFNPTRFPSLSKFEREFCFGWGTDGVKVDFEQLIKVMKKQVIRRRKDEVKIQLPEKTREFRFVEMTDAQRNVYDQLRDRFFIELDEMDPSKVLTATAIIAQLTRLRQVATYPGAIQITNPDGSITKLNCDESAKLDEALDIIEELQNEDEQVVVFSSQFNGPLHRLSELLSGRGISSQVLSGDNSSQVDDLCEAFRQKEFQVFLINAKSGGEGLNLQKSSAWPGGASHAIFLDLWYNPMFNVQAEDRLHRKGQTDPVTIHILQAEDSVDAFIADILEKKEAMIEGIVEDESLRPSDWRSKLEGLI